MHLDPGFENEAWVDRPRNQSAFTTHNSYVLLSPKPELAGYEQLSADGRAKWSISLLIMAG